MPVDSNAGLRFAARMRPAHVALAGFVLLYSSWQAWRWIPLRQELAGDILGLAMPPTAAYCAWRASQRTAALPRLCRAWQWVALAMLAESAGNIVQSVYDLEHVRGYPTLADPMYVSVYGFLFLGVLSFPGARRSGREALELALECAIVGSGIGALFMYFIIGPSVDVAGSALAKAFSVAYPVGDVVVLVGLSSVLLRGTLASVRRSLWLMAVATGLFTLADLIYGYIVLHGTYRGGDPIDTVYVLAFAGFALAGMTQGPVDGSEVAVPPARASHIRANWLPYAAVAVGLATVIVKDSNESFFPDLSITVSVGVIVLLMVARQLLSQASLRQSRAHLAHAQEIAQIGSWEWDVLNDTIERSEEDLRLYGWEQGGPQPTSYEPSIRAIHPDDRERVAETIQAALRGEGPFEYEMRLVRPDGEVRTLLVRGEVETHGGRIVKVHGTRQDITERKRMEEQLRHQADHDPLTGLYNRRRFAEELDRALVRCHRHSRPCALLLLDLDHFKFVNDTHGHAAGDRALKLLGQAIQARVRSSDVVARLGGDEFAIVLPEAGERDALAVAEELRLDIAACDIDPPVCIAGGLLLYDGQREMVADDALIAADIALYEAKESGKNQIRVYSDRDRASAAVTWVERIRHALAEERFVLDAQPMVDLKGEDAPYHELLIRMVSDSGEVIPPGAFLPTAERFGLINEIDRWVTREGLLRARGGDRMSINLSAHSIGDESILAQVRAAIAAGLDPSDVIFEITESAAMGNMTEARSFTESLVALGCDVALDDFGTGFGSFIYLKHLPARYLKIDMEFVREMLVNETDRQVVDAIVKVAQSLGKKTIAEGVEDETTMEALRAYGVDRAQGFFVGRPRRVAPLERTRAR